MRRIFNLEYALSMTSSICLFHVNQQTFSTPQKTETMVISRKVNKPHHQSLIMNNQQLEDVKYHKHLGVTISDDGS
jgi:hypothetical protein